MVKAQTNLEIKEYCKILHLRRILSEFEEKSKNAESYEDYLHDLLSLEVDALTTRSCEKRIANAKFPYRKCLEDLEMNCLSASMQKELPYLATLDFIREGRNLVLFGNPGTGKTHCSIGLGIKACEEGFSVLFITVPLLITELKEAKNTNTLGAYQRKFLKYDLVICDELGYASFDRAGADLFFTLLSLRVDKKSTVITSNLTFTRWNEVFGDPTVTGAMIDRLTYKAILVNMEGESYRLRETLRANGLTMDDLLAKAELHNKLCHE